MSKTDIVTQSRCAFLNPNKSKVYGTKFGIDQTDALQRKKYLQPR